MSVQEIGGSGKSGKERLQGYPGRKRKEHACRARILRQARQ